MTDAERDDAIRVLDELLQNSVDVPDVGFIVSAGCMVNVCALLARLKEAQSH